MEYENYKYFHVKGAPNLVKEKVAFQLYRETKFHKKLYEQVADELEKLTLKEQKAQDRNFYGSI